LLVGSFVCEEDRASPSPSRATARIPPRSGDGGPRRRGASERVARRCAIRTRSMRSEAHRGHTSHSRATQRPRVAPRHPGGDGLAQVSHTALRSCATSQGDGMHPRSLTVNGSSLCHILRTTELVFTPNGHRMKTYTLRRRHRRPLERERRIARLSLRPRSAPFPPPRASPARLHR
jgi:hypothetical protein